MNGTLTIAETAKRLKVHYNTVYRWIHTGILPAIKLGGRYKITLKDLKVFTSTQRDRDELSKKIPV